jgi:hypothetical protein
MRSQSVVILVLAFGAAFAIVGGAGLDAAWGVDGATTDGEAVRDALNESAQNSSVNDESPVRGDPATDDGDGNIVSLVLDGAGTIASAAGKVVLLPATLMGLGAPAWFAVPLGSFAVFVTGVGIIQFVTGRVWR